MPKKRTPTNILEMRGSRKGAARAKTEPKPEPGSEEPPVWLKENARKHWPEIHPTLARLGIFGETDEIALGLLCEAFGEYLELRDVVTRTGYIALTKNKQPYQSPAVGMRNAAHDRLLKLLIEFGLTPAARSTVTAVAPDTRKSTLDSIING